MSAPPPDPKKKPAPRGVEGIDLSDFDDKPVAGMKLSEEVQRPKEDAPPKKESEPKRPAPNSATPAPPVRPAAIHRPVAATAPALAPSPAVRTPPVAEPKPAPPVPAPASPTLSAPLAPPSTPEVSPPPAPFAGAYPPFPLPPAFGYPQAPTPGLPYGAAYPYPYPTAYYPPYPAPSYGYPIALPPPGRVWATKVGLARVITAVSIAFGVYALEILSKIFEGTTGVTDAPGSHAMATLGVNALAFLLLAGRVLFLGASLFAGASGVFKLREGRGELGPSGGEASRRGLLFLGAAAGLPFATLILSSIYLATVQATLPGSGMVSDLGLERLWEHYRTVVFVNALVGLAAAFLFVKGLDSVLPRAASAVPRAQFRTFGTLFVTAAAANAALVLITFFALLNPPVVGAQASPAFANALLAVGPGLAVLAFWHLRSYLQATLREVERRIREKAMVPDVPPSAAP